MSPEIFKNKPYSFKSDIWALGCVLYEMTTLNHAFDANSLNGLATKIVKGKYPPVHAKYSKFLRDLIGQMLLLNPQQRPDLDQILRKPFIKKHIINFFSDIASRPSASIGEGTMIMKAAAGALAGAPSAAGVSNDTNMISLQKQLHMLNMSQELADALKPKSVPQDDNEAIKLAKEQASALKREQEHKKMVESALEKLRQERENRLKEKKVDPNAGAAGGGAAGLARPVGYPQPQGRAAPAPAPAAVAPAPLAAGRPNAAAAGQRPSYAANQPPLAQQIPQRAAPAPAVAPAPFFSPPDAQRNRRQQEEDDNRSVGSKKEHPPQAGRRRSFESNPVEPSNANVNIGLGAAQAAERERKQRLLLQQQQQEIEAAKHRAEEQRKREEVRLEARAREEARLREEARQKEEAARKSQLEFAARRDALAQREKEREREREKERDRQREEIEQLKRDKLELDRRANERDRLREERRTQERGRIEGDKFTSYDPPPPNSSRSSHGGGGGAAGVGQLARGPSYVADEKGSGGDSSSNTSSTDNLTAREKVQLRRQEKQAKEDAAKLEVLREAEAENRRVRQAAQNQNRYQYYATPQQPVEDSKYEFDPRKPKNRSGMDVSEINDKLNDITKGKSRLKFISIVIPVLIIVEHVIVTYITVQSK